MADGQTQDSDKRQVPQPDLMATIMKFATGTALVGGLMSSLGAAHDIPTLSGPTASPSGFGAIFGNMEKSIGGVAPMIGEGLKIGMGFSLMDMLMNLGNTTSAPQTPQPQQQAPSLPQPSFGGMN